MFNNKKCAKCKWRGGYYRHISTVTCDYGLIHNVSCIYYEDGELKDRRGDNPKKCALYEKGDMHRRLTLEYRLREGNFDD